jgi:hypothetical protein
MDELTTIAVGTDFPNGEKSQSHCMHCAPGNPAEVWPEQKDPFDANAAMYMRRAGSKNAAGRDPTHNA